MERVLGRGSFHLQPLLAVLQFDQSGPGEDLRNDFEPRRQGVDIARRCTSRQVIERLKVHEPSLAL